MGKITKYFKEFEWKWSLVAQGVAFVSAFALPAWATLALDYFNQYSPLSWVVAGFSGILVTSIVFLAYGLSKYALSRANFNALFTEKHPNVDPMLPTFDKKRIFLNSFVLPSNPIIEGKTFVDCEIIGPANIFFIEGNAIAEPGNGPTIDLVYLPPDANPTNGIGFKMCTFRRCSFHMATVFVYPNDYEKGYEELANRNWVSLLPPTHPPTLITDPTNNPD